MAAASGERRIFANHRELDPEREIDRQQQPLVDDLQDRARCRIVVISLAAIDRVGGRKRHHARLGIDRPTRQLEAVDVPGILGFAAGLDPIFCRLDEFVRWHDRVDELHRLGALDTQLVTLEEELKRVRRLQHPRDARRAAGAGKQSDLDLRQAEPGLRILRRHAIVAGEAELEPTADRGAVDGGDPRFAAGLDAPIEQRELPALLEKAFRRLLLAVLPRECTERTRERLEQRQIGAGAERVFRRCNDDAFHRGIARELLDEGRQFLDALARDHVHRAVRHVPGHERDAVAVDIELEV